MPKIILSKYTPKRVNVAMYEISHNNNQWTVNTPDGLKPFKTGFEAFVYADHCLHGDKGSQVHQNASGGK